MEAAGRGDRSMQQRPRACYDRHRARGATHQQALRTLANRWVGILHGCLRHRACYDELTAWPAPQQRAA